MSCKLPHTCTCTLYMNMYMQQETFKGDWQEERISQTKLLQNVKSIMCLQVHVACLNSHGENFHRWLSNHKVCEMFSLEVSPLHSKLDNEYNIVITFFLLIFSISLKKSSNSVILLKSFSSRPLSSGVISSFIPLHRHARWHKEKWNIQSVKKTTVFSYQEIRFPDYHHYLRD